MFGNYYRYLSGPLAHLSPNRSNRILSCATAFLAVHHASTSSVQGFEVQFSYGLRRYLFKTGVCHRTLKWCIAAITDRPDGNCQRLHKDSNTSHGAQGSRSHQSVSATASA